MLAGDAISNYKTVLSFAREDQIINDYEKMLEKPVAITKKKGHIIGLTFGFS